MHKIKNIFTTDGWKQIMFASYRQVQKFVRGRQENYVQNEEDINNILSLNSPKYQYLSMYA